MAHKQLAEALEKMGSDGVVTVEEAKGIETKLENAVSVAGVLLLTEATMTELPEPKVAPTAAETGME